MTSVTSTDAASPAFSEGGDTVAFGHPEPASVGAQMRNGLAWKTASQITSQIARVAMTVILARLLTPADFGIAGMVLVFSGLIQLLSDVGFSSSLVQFKTLSDEDGSTAFWTGLGVASAFFLISLAAAPAVADFYGLPQLRWMFVAVSTGFLTTALSGTQASLLWRRMEFRALEIRGMVCTVVASIVGIGAAVAGFGAWSLILQAVAFSVTSVIAIWAVSPWRPRFAFSIASLRRMAAFSMNVFLSRLLSYADRNADNLLVGRFLGSTALGTYSIGYSAILVPFDRLVWPIQNVVVPALASLQDEPERMRAVWLRGIRLIGTVMLPALGGVIVVCPDLVPVVFGGRWNGAVVIIQILAWVAALQSLSALNAAVMQSSFRTGMLLKLTGFIFALDLGAFVIGLHWGVRGVAAGYAVTNTLVITPLSLALVLRLLDVRVAQFVTNLRGVLEATLLMAGAILILRQLLELASVQAPVRLVLVIAAGLVIYVPVCLWRDPRILEEPPLRRVRTRLTARFADVA